MKIQSTAVQFKHHQIKAFAICELATLLTTVSLQMTEGTGSTQRDLVQRREIVGKVEALCKQLETHPLQSIRDRYCDETDRLRRLVESISA